MLNINQKSIEQNEEVFTNIFYINKYLIITSNQFVYRIETSNNFFTFSTLDSILNEESSSTHGIEYMGKKEWVKGVMSADLSRMMFVSGTYEVRIVKD